MKNYNPFEDLFPHGTTVFIDIRRGLKFCMYDAPYEAWDQAVDSTQRFQILDETQCIRLPVDTPLIYLGIDKSKKSAYLRDMPWVLAGDAQKYQPHAFLYKAQLLIKPVPWDERNYRPLGAIRGLFWMPEESDDSQTT
jgi:hypothetical protein